MAKKKSTNKKTSSYWLVPAVLTVLVGCALMWYWWKIDMKTVEMEEENLVMPSSAPVDTTMNDAEVKGSSTSEEIDAMFKKLDTSSTSTDDLSDLTE